MPFRDAHDLDAILATTPLRNAWMENSVAGPEVNANNNTGVQLGGQSADIADAKDDTDMLYTHEDSPNATSTRRFHSPAMSAVFATTELVEGLLFAMQPADILIATAVCTKWRLLVERSEALQHKIYQGRYDGYLTTHSDGTTSAFLFYDCMNGTLLIRRVGDTEVIAWFKGGRLQFADGKKRTVKFEFNADTSYYNGNEYYFWTCEWHDRTTQQKHKNSMQWMMNVNQDLDDYLERFREPSEEVLESRAQYHARLAANKRARRARRVAGGWRVSDWVWEERTRTWV